MNDSQLLRYSRHILLSDDGIERQTQLLESRVLIVGAGGLGCAAAQYLASSGVGQIELVDDDAVELSNLQRQTMHTHASIGQLKVDSLARALLAINPEISVVSHALRADQNWLMQAVEKVDLVLDCSDNFATRQAINSACVQWRKPLVVGAAIRFDGQVGCFDFRQPESPCYACLFPPTAIPEDIACATMGVFAPLVGLIGSIQSAMAIACLTNPAHELSGQWQMLQLDSKKPLNESTLKTNKAKACPVCSHHS